MKVDAALICRCQVIVEMPDEDGHVPVGGGRKDADGVRGLMYDRRESTGPKFFQKVVTVEDGLFDEIRGRIMEDWRETAAIPAEQGTFPVKVAVVGHHAAHFVAVFVFDDPTVQIDELAVEAREVSCIPEFEPIEVVRPHVPAPRDVAFVIEEFDVRKRGILVEDI
ncbi:hypothetical protein GCM10009000_077730 [Halobacterium noricense]|uniref:Uncharacterized protein n=1 Tax=Haladaptatus pallidirubidus TaxID=1008152 RepID=A0AAV3UNW1_9EURY